MPAPMRERILTGAAEAVARHGLQKLDMGDVSTASGVSRATLYRYFPSRNELLAQLAHREGLRFQERMLRAVERTPPGPERVLLVLQHATQHVLEHPVLQRILETDPAFVLRGLRGEFTRVKSQLRQLLAEPLAKTEMVRRGVATTDQLLDWMVRLMISVYLIPDPHPEQMAEGLTAVYEILSAKVRTDAPARRAQRRRTKRP
jgi:AcrR family transcriptional regulator